MENAPTTRTNDEEVDRPKVNNMNDKDKNYGDENAGMGVNEEETFAGKKNDSEMENGDAVQNDSNENKSLVDIGHSSNKNGKENNHKSRWGPRTNQQPHPSTQRQQQYRDPETRDNTNVMRNSPHSRSNVYIPPAKRRRFEQDEQMKRRHKAAAEEEEEEEGAEPEEDDPWIIHQKDLKMQQETWLLQSRKIHGCINRLSVHNIKNIILDLLENVNLIRMRGCLAHSLLQAMTSTTSTSYLSLYASFLAVLHSKLPVVGQVTVHRCVAFFRRAYQRRDKASVTSLALALSHFFVHAVVHELLILQLLTLLLSGGNARSSGPTADSLSIAIQVFEIVGSTLQQVTKTGYRAILDQFRATLASQRDLHPKIQQSLQQLLLDKPQFQLDPRLDLVELEDQITLTDLDLDQPDLETHPELNSFSFDPNYAKEEQEWKAIQKELLGLDSDEEPDADDDDADDDQQTDQEEEEEEENQTDEQVANGGGDKTNALVQVQDLTEADLVHLRRTIYLTIMSSAGTDECVHKLAKIEIPDGREEELINMLLECCAQERTFQKSYGVIGEKFCLMADRWKLAFQTAFAQQYSSIHRLETNKLRNVAKFFAHLLHTHALPWSLFSNIKMTAETTTSSSRIFVKILLQEMSQALGMQSLIRQFRLKQDSLTTTTTLQDNKSMGDESKTWFQGLFPMQGNLRETRYAINFLTSIGLGPLTDTMRQYLKNAPLIAQQQAEMAKQQQQDDDDESSVLSSSSSSSSSSSETSSSSSSSVSSSSSSSSSDSRRRRKRRRYSTSSSNSDSRSPPRHRRNDDYQRRNDEDRREKSPSKTGRDDLEERGEKRDRR